MENPNHKWRFIAGKIPPFPHLESTSLPNCCGQRCAAAPRSNSNASRHAADVTRARSVCSSGRWSNSKRPGVRKMAPRGSQTSNTSDWSLPSSGLVLNCTVQAFGFSNRREIGRQIWGKCGCFAKGTWRQGLAKKWRFYHLQFHQEN